MIKLAVDRPVLTTMIILSLVVFGLFSYVQLSQELMPNIDFPFVVVTAIYPGAGPKEVESQVTEYLEEEIGSVAGLERMESQSLENLALIICQFELEVDGNQAAIDVKDKVDLAMINLPEALEPPVVQQFSFASEPILNVAVNSDRPIKETTLIAETRLKDALSKINGVSKVEIIGGLEREINVSCNIDRLRSFGLSIMDVVGFIQAENLNFPTGQITGAKTEYSLRLVGEFKTLDDIRNIRLITPAGGVVYLKDVATIRDDHEKPTTQARFQGKPAVSIKVQKKEGANTVLVSERIHKAITKLGPWLEQERITATIANDRAKYIKESIRDVISNIAIGILLTSLLLYLFLHDFRSTIIVAVAMPSCVLATFSLMNFAGFTINIVSMMALGISIGVLVTNSIVVLENISNKLAQGKDSRTAAIEGTREIALAVAASTMTNIVVFTPIAFMKGIIGRIFLQFGLTVVFATIVSLLVSFTVTPMLANLLLSKPKKRLKKSSGPSVLERFGGAWDRFYDDLAQDYRRALTWVLKNRKTKALVVLASFLAFIGGIMLLGQSGSEFFPESDDGILRVEAKLPPGTSLEQTDRALTMIERAIAGIPEIDTVLAEIGGTGKGANEGKVTVNLVDVDLRERNTRQVVDTIRPLVAFVPAAEIVVAMGEGGSGPQAGLQVEITGPDLTQIQKLAKKVMELARRVEGVIDVSSSYETGKPELSFVPDRNQLTAYGLTSVQVGQVLRIAFEGQEVTYFRENGEDYDIRVQLDRQERSDLPAFEQMLIRVGEDYIPLSQLGKISFSQSETKVERQDKQRIIKVMANVSGITSGEGQASLQKLMDKGVTVPPNYEIKFGGEAEMREKEFGYIFQALILAIILTYMVLAAILEDFVHPFTIMLTLPLGLVGVGLALFLSGVSINLMSLMAIVMLVGIVVNNAILILDYAKQLRTQGMDKTKALIEASTTRLRPIIMTNLAIAISVMPQALGGSGAEFRRALAIVTMGGVLISAVFTLFLIPAIYTTFDRIAIKPKVKSSEDYEG